ncbi:UDP-2,4-diacetamido-2,4,6-trideoxy-beta-L-altropyranose hydrolase [Herminiimonas sp. KBW02]|uniref:UDP-2,4-diacetamido-2,4, 6-trideoxy-beta-L-altropyranose hydrolase n=1 Tax=Herminiimonas sp. KBW02 TaxID=2153363 RepID=UPI000F59498B|nr:UDP-2,4-diacetamido-2,4,6-trideoxy-beta-L-altropyranose hydrolase [Herminiimonas sp. KBW02]RQO36088.1 UDP-2,4-diacetamido-2,4,6-trideoxy-beta-L-altropyranose hydrolase [Herminiimonas sp. KBW02]
MKNYKEKIAFRVDASNLIGTGHLMRCITLADGLKQKGRRTRFVSRNLPDYLCSMLKEKKHEVAQLPSSVSNIASDDLKHSSWLECEQEQDAVDTANALGGETWDWIVVDHYALDHRWESMLRHVAKKVMVIDDLADRRHDCDVLLDQNLYVDMQGRYAGKVSANCKLLLGPQYALLRNEFGVLHKVVKPRIGDVKRILVFFGGVDADNYTGHAIEALSRLAIDKFHIDIVIGAQHPCRERIIELCSAYNFRCHVQTNQLAELMAAADLSIGAGGVASWERCCVGLPSIVFCLAENQRELIEDAAQLGLIYAPEVGEDLTYAIETHTLALVENSNLRNFMSRNGMDVVVGQGLSMVLMSLAIVDIEIKEATLADSENLFCWRNHPEIRKFSRDNSVLDWSDHQRWFFAVLEDPQRVLLIGRAPDGAPIGVVRFDMQNNEAEISIYLVPDKLTSGLGRSLLLSAEQWLAKSYPNISQIKAYILNKNKRSSMLFSRSDYQIESTLYSKSLHSND